MGAKLNDKRALWELGNRYFWGEGVLRDEGYALELWEKSVEMNYIHAQFTMGTYYLKGMRGVEKNIDMGLELLNRACQQKYMRAVHYLERYLIKLEE